MIGIRAFNMVTLLSSGYFDQQNVGLVMAASSNVTRIFYCIVYIGYEECKIITNLLRWDLTPQTDKEIFKIFKMNSLTLVFHADCMVFTLE